MNVFQFICILDVFFVSILCVFSKEPTKFSPGSFYAKTTSFQCFGNPEIVTNISCKLKPINWELSYAAIQADLLVTLRNVTVRLETFKYTNQFRPFLINVTFNACEAMKFRNMHSYAKIITNIFLKYSNLDHTCPFSGHVNVDRSYFDSDLVPFNIPGGDYKLLTSMYEGWPLVRFGSIHYAFTIKERKRNTRKWTKKIP